MDAALIQGAEIAIRHLQASGQVVSWVDPVRAAKIMIGQYEKELRERL